ncbi:MAG: hypothetical protein BGO82_12555 [Devosia sp. 67-54]|nr:MAG: hypothetical protein BGO82_12555 [Devosia sp. 67-54]
MEPGTGSVVVAASAGGPALRPSAVQIDARRDAMLLGGVYLWYRSAVLATAADRRAAWSR